MTVTAVAPMTIVRPTIHLMISEAFMHFDPQFLDLFVKVRLGYHFFQAPLYPRQSFPGFISKIFEFCDPRFHV